MNLVRAEDGTSSELRLEGAINIASAAELKSLLLNAYTEVGELRICLNGVSEMDVCAMQLLIAAERHWRQSAKPFALAGPLQPQVAASIASAGLSLLQATTDVSALRKV